MAPSLSFLLLAGAPLAGAWLAASPPRNLGGAPRASAADARGASGHSVDAAAGKGLARRLPRRAVLAAGGAALGLTALAAKTAAAYDQVAMTMNGGGAGPEIFDWQHSGDLDEAIDAPFNDAFFSDGAATGVVATTIDAAVHVWSNGEKPFPWAEPPPHGLAADAATGEKLVQLLEDTVVAGALIVQPIVHKFDHSYVASVLKAHPGKFKGVCLANPTLGPDAAANELTKLKKQGFVGVRLNPSLFPEGSGGLSGATCDAICEKAGLLNMPVSLLLAAGGFKQHGDDVERLLTEFPGTTFVLDHYGFIPCQSRAAEYSATMVRAPEVEWTRLLKLAAHPNLYVKASAPFRISEFGFPFVDVRAYTLELIEAFGARRLLFGTDFPFALKVAAVDVDDDEDWPDAGDETTGVYGAASSLLYEWQLALTPEEMQMLQRGTAEKIYGKW